MNFQRTGKCVRSMPYANNGAYVRLNNMPRYDRSRDDDMYSRCAANNDNVAPQNAMAMVYAPYQTWKDIYDPQKALCKGTVFEELFKPFCPCRHKEVL